MYNDRRQSDPFVIHKVIPTVHTANSPTLFWPNAFLGSHFAPAFFSLPKERRQALKVLYAFFRKLDDAVDKPVRDPRPYLDGWLEYFREADQKSIASFGENQLLHELDLVIKKYDIPLFSMADFISIGLLTDIRTNRFETPMDLERYCYGVAGTVGVACLPIFGVPWQEAKDFAVRLGIAVQWINIIRDVGTDADLGRIYLPTDHLEKFGVRETDLLEKRSSQQFQDLIRYEAEVARGYHARAMELLPKKWGHELIPALLMGTIYLKLLAKIEKHNYPVLNRRISLNVFEKLGVMIRGIGN